MSELIEAAEAVLSALRQCLATPLPPEARESAERASVRAAEVVSKLRRSAERPTLDSLLVELSLLLRQTREIFDSAKQNDNHRLALAAIQRVETQVELQGKLIGELATAPTVNVGVVVLPERFVTVLERHLSRLYELHPETRPVVAELLQSVSTEISA